MPDTKRLSTRSSPAWASQPKGSNCWVATIEPSKIHRYLVLICTVATGRCVYLLDTGIDSQLLLAATYVALLTRLFHANKQSYLMTHNSDNNWSFSPAGSYLEPRWWTKNPQTVRNGQLMKSGYRSANLVVLVFDEELVDTDDNSNRFGRKRSRQIRIPIWRDCVNTSDFSYLHLQLAYAATPLPTVKERLLATLRYTWRRSFKTGCSDETTDLSRR